jgi:hypothetical protein
MESMEAKRDNLIAAQTNSYIFVTVKSVQQKVQQQHLLIEIFDKDQFVWISSFQLESPVQFAEYEFQTLKEQDDMHIQKILLIERISARQAKNHVIQVETTSDESLRVSSYPLNSGASDSFQ